MRRPNPLPVPPPLYPRPWLRLAKKRTAAIGFQPVTVCIAIARRDFVIIVTDMLLANEHASQDSSAKARELDPDYRWVYAFTTDDVTHEKEIARRIRSRISKTTTEDDLKAACVAAYDEYILHRVNRYLSKYGWTRDEFMARGPGLGSDVFARLLFDVGNITAGIELMIAGYPPRKNVVLFSIAPDGEITDHTELGFHAIGAGAWAALGSLYTHRDTHGPVGLAVYRACAAKFAAETARSVGSETDVTVVFKTGKVSQFPVFDATRQSWLKIVSLVPDDAVVEIENRVAEMTFKTREPDR